MRNEENKFPFSMYKESGEGRIVNSRCHKTSMEIVEVTSGCVKVQIGTEFIEAKEGDFLYVPPSMMFRVESEAHACIRGMIFDTSIIEANLENFESEVFYMFYVQSKNKITVFNSDHPIHSTLRRFMQDSYDEYSEKDVCYKLPIRANIYQIMTVLLRYYCGSKNELDRMIYHNVLRLRPVIAYIDEHFKEKIYIEELSAMINVSPDYFTKMFKESIGKTPIDYINGMRVNCAMELLCSSDMAMSDIADTIGFCNPNYFHKIFKQYMVTSPLAYRKSAQ
jgi:YesN/AraC family two-component response regulator